MAMMSEVIGRVRDYLDDNDWKYEFNPDKNVIKMGVNIKSKLQSAKMLISFNEGGYSVFAIPSMNADESSRPAVLEYISRANYGLRNGNFEMDLRDGEVRYKVYTNFKGLKDISNEVIDDSILIPPMMLQKYGDGLAAIMLGFSDPVTEINKAEK